MPDIDIMLKLLDYTKKSTLFFRYNEVLRLGFLPSQFEERIWEMWNK
jgi:hypothetical protein